MKEKYKRMNDKAVRKSDGGDRRTGKCDVGIAGETVKGKSQRLKVTAAKKIIKLKCR